MSHSNRYLGALALLLSIVALGLSVVAFQRSSEAISAADETYDRAVEEVWTLIVPVFDDFDVTLPRDQPQTLTEALSPFFRLAQSLSETPPDPLDR